LTIANRRAVNAQIRRIQHDPGWIEGRHPAPANSEHHGCMLDFNVPAHAIVYRMHRGGREVEIVDVFPFFVG